MKDFEYLGLCAQPSWQIGAWHIAVVLFIDDLHVQ